MRTYYVYIMASSTCTLYVGVTNDLERRVFEHKQGLVPGFTRRYGVKRLVHYEDTNDVSVAIAREKQIKGWRRSKKVDLVESMNPGWRDLSDGWYGEMEGAGAPVSRMDSSLHSE
jgi:putative endonuclease